ncbi:MAG: dehydrogenase [Stygiobacter sp. RIFOXYA12_FULL_38_9]|nr:MAG: dehydrogenase [Stygiobacter sp. RIFOXYA12_FULL_38_9]OGV07083.1 MAG: dehydrogenase [Stygiobacter sp. RIFOXYB2_FULL_37_11]OGV11021.1 MAG: dehydrogenase [Stygiobacter sp. RIFOXYA2_FULL_38_8]OGV12401.1 MAG: dehydrogenase [Stygiobacter sp. RIFOXYC2_FULL_38_25]OGV83047.1 MAG: dehydrogenase [Stygiobacter sp. GWF2_38_21]RJQ58149.1 MAG: FAD-binding oxidoreductase [Stygiobacter sp.]
MILKTDPEEFQNYLSDASNYSGTADKVFLPESEEEIIELVKEANLNRTRITISGNGTGLNGGRVPEGGVVLSLEKLNKILEMNETEKFVRVQPAVILKDLQDYVEEKKLFYPPDPTERNCFIGATVATNSSGARTFKYGPTRDYVLAIRVVLPNGEIVYLERGKQNVENYSAKLLTEQGSEINISVPQFEMPNTKNASGYYCKANMDLIDLFIGSEGTLGIITELKLKLLDYNDNVLSCVVFFPTEDDAFNFIDEARAITKSNGVISARALEFFDKLTLDFLRPDYATIPLDTCCVWFEQELDETEEQLTEAWLELIDKHNADAEKAWIAVDKNEQEKFKDFRHAIAWRVNETVARRGLKKIGTDISVPVESFRSFYKWMTKFVEETNIEYVVYGHFGNCHPHLNMLPKDQADFVRSKEIYFEICKEAVRLKGTVSAEHGIGKMKRDYLLMMYGEDTIKQMAKLKLTFDPNRILNIGNIFEEKYLQ